MWTIFFSLKVPVLPEPWSGVRDATRDCNVCAQFDFETNSTIGSEDCLYLNIHAPRLAPDDFLPVMVFFHGGGFIHSNGTDSAKHGFDYLIDKDVIVVTLNYRLGILGFLALDRKDAPGNMGLRDQVQALKWIQKNIKQFGGDPNNVTIFGSSAGGASVQYLMLSPLAKNLFHKAIAHSGSSLLPWAQYDEIKVLASKIPAIYEELIENDEQLLKYLKEMPIDKLVMSSLMVVREIQSQGGLFFGFVPTIESSKDWEPFLDKSPYILLARGDFYKVPFITGFCSREGLIMCEKTAQRKLNNLINENNFGTYLDKFFAIDDTDIDEVTRKLEKVYLSKQYEEPEDYGIDFFTDIDFLGGIYTSCVYIQKYNSSVYLYEFAYDGNLNKLKKKLKINRKGACHADDTGYLMNSELLQSEKLTKTDELVKERLLLMWTNFAKIG